MQKLVEKLWKPIVPIPHHEWKFELWTPLSLPSKDSLLCYFVMRTTLWMTFRQCSLKFRMPKCLLVLGIIAFLVIGRQSRPSCTKPSSPQPFARSWMNPVCLGWPIRCAPHRWPPHIHSCLQKVSPKIMHMLCKTKHVVTKSGTLFKCTSILFKMIRHLPFSIPNARSTHMRVKLWTKFQWYFSRERPSLWPLKGANIQGRHW